MPPRTRILKASATSEPIQRMLKFSLARAVGAERAIEHIGFDRVVPMPEIGRVDAIFPSDHRNLDIRLHQHEIA